MDSNDVRAGLAPPTRTFGKPPPPSGGETVLTPARSAQKLGGAQPSAPRSGQLCAIGYFAKISSIRLNALSAACSGAMPLFITSKQETMTTCSAPICAIAGL
jgi:hypothetical protein